MPVPSRFEDTLLRHKEDEDSFYRYLFKYLDDGISLKRLRAVSCVLHDLVDTHPGRLFRYLYIRAPLLDGHDLGGLNLIAPLCYSLTIKVGYHVPEPKLLAPMNEPPRTNLKRRPSLWGRRSTKSGGKASTSASSIQSLSLNSSTYDRPPISASHTSPFDRQKQIDERQLWTGVLSRFRQLRSLTLRIKGDPAWPGRTAVEDMLITIRVALESANLAQLRQLTFQPVHAMGIIHLRWDGIGAFSQAHASGAQLWMQIETLDLRIKYPFANGKLSEAQQLMFKKILYEYLRSFAPSLRCLRLVWLGGEGPSPLALHKEAGLEDRPAMRWPKLEELYVGSVQYPNQMIKQAREYARPDTCVKVLRSARRDSFAVASDSSAWVEVLSPMSPDVCSPVADSASSVYSQDDQAAGSDWEGAISRSSRDVICKLDL